MFLQLFLFNVIITFHYLRIKWLIIFSINYTDYLSASHCALNSTGIYAELYWNDRILEKINLQGSWRYFFRLTIFYTNIEEAGFQKEVFCNKLQLKIQGCYGGRIRELQSCGVLYLYTQYAWGPCRPYSFL